MNTLDQQGAEPAAEANGTAAPSSVAHVPRSVKDALLELLKYGLLEEARKPNVYRTAVANREAIERILAPLDLVMKIDDVRGLAFVVVAAQAFDSEEGDEWAHPLVRRQRLNLEQSLLLAILRQQFIAHEQEAGVGSTGTVVALDDLLPQLKVFLGDPHSEVQEQKRLRALLEQLKAHGIVSDVDAQDQVQIRPIIAHLANPANLQNLIQAIRTEAQRTQGETATSSKEPE